MPGEHEILRAQGRQLARLFVSGASGVDLVEFGRGDGEKTPHLRMDRCLMEPTPRKNSATPEIGTCIDGSPNRVHGAAASRQPILALAVALFLVPSLFAAQGAAESAKTAVAAPKVLLAGSQPPANHDKPDATASTGAATQPSGQQRAPSGQEAPGHRSSSSDHHHLAKVEIFGGYSYLREEGANLNGWNAAVVGNLNNWFSLAADFSGHYGNHEGDDVSVHGFTFGPHFSWRKHKRVTPFAFTLLGFARKEVTRAGLTESHTGFAMDLGGGLDVHLNKLASLRVFQLDAAVTRIEGRTETAPRLSFGVVFHLGSN